LLTTATVEEQGLILYLSLGAPRASEVCRVKDEHVDWEARKVLLPRTKGGPRQVVLPPLVYDTLLSLRGRTPLFGCQDRWSVNRALTRACKRAGVPRLTSHKIGRHSFAARLLKQGHSLKHVQEAGGWSVASMAMLARTYAHLEQSAVEQAVRMSDTDLAQILARVEKSSKNKTLSQLKPAV
ncbi:MAG TPA: tyrosine-type recombinase/integrase, partial [Hyphomicrobiaceae bacterium]|nr:tyrosine-type recombinase/integrase [Hyphomicrobiaceae bacterium]